MKKKGFFNVNEFNYALDFMYKDVYLSELKFREYLKKYPYDYSTYPYYATILVNLGKLDMVEKLLDDVETMVKYDKKFNDNKKKLYFFKKNMMYVKIRLLCYQEKYDEICKMRPDIDDFDELEVETIMFYCKKKLGLLTEEKNDSLSYILRQILDYDEVEFRQHINKHLAKYNKDLIVPNSSVFVDDFPIDEVLQEFKKYVFNDTRIFHGFFDDLYIFKYDNCGTVDNKASNYFKIICFHDTDNIITMCPTSSYVSMPHIDFNYLNCDVNDVKVKRLSQIDKFNRKYNIK